MSGPRNQLLVGDARTELSFLDDARIDMVLTSPPYFRLRDYQVVGQVGLEHAVDKWVHELTLVAGTLHRVLTPTGSMWLNVGDTYSTHLSEGTLPKSLLLGPERLALRLIADGWILRNKIVWRKTNPMPTSVRDRLACTWEYVYVFAKSPKYFFDLDAIRVPHTSTSNTPTAIKTVRGRQAWRGPNSVGVTGLDALNQRGLVGHPLGKNPGDVWQIASSSYRGGHHATFPLQLADRAILVGCPEARCVACRLPWRRNIIRSVGGSAVRGALGPTCACNANSEPGMVLDPFIGSGTTAVAAETHGRDWLGIELNPSFAAEAEGRIRTARAGPRAA